MYDVILARFLAFGKDGVGCLITVPPRSIRGPSSCPLSIHGFFGDDLSPIRFRDPPRHFVRSADSSYGGMCTGMSITMMIREEEKLKYFKDGYIYHIYIYQEKYPLIIGFN